MAGVELAGRFESRQLAPEPVGSDRRRYWFDVQGTSMPAGWSSSGCNHPGPTSAG